MMDKDGEVGDERLVDIGEGGVVAGGGVAFDAKAGAVQFQRGPVGLVPIAWIELVQVARRKGVRDDRRKYAPLDFGEEILNR